MPEPRPQGRPTGDRRDTAWSARLLARWSAPRSVPGGDAPHAGTASAAEPGGPAPVPEHIFCKRCGYDLSGTHELVLCPECGKEFDFLQPKTFDRVPRREMRQRAAWRVLLVLVLTGLIMAGLNATVIPRPISKHHPTLWLWFNQPIGVQRSPVIGPTNYRVTWHFGQPRGVRVYDRAALTGQQRVLAELSRASMEADHFVLRVHADGLRLENLLYAFNTLRTDDEVFGIQWMRDQPRLVSVGAFESSGTMAEVMEAIVGHYGIRVQPLLLDRPSVCVFVPEGVELPDEATARGMMLARRAIEGAGIIGPGLVSELSPIDRAYHAIDHRLRATPGPPVGEAIAGRIVWVSVDQAETLGYRVERPLAPVMLQRLDWRSARTGWY